MRITQSTLGAADKCLLSFQFQMDRPSWAKQTASADRVLGTGYHAGLAQYYGERLKSNDAAPDADAMIGEAIRIFDISTVTDLYDNTPIERFLWTDKIPDASTAHGLLRDLLTAYVAGGWWWGNEFEVIGVELNETIADPETGRHFKLGADLALRSSDRITLVDHKSSAKAWSSDKHEARKQNQSPLYSWAARRHYDVDRVDFAFDIITLPGARTPVRFDRRITTPGVDVEAAIVKKADDLMSLYEVVHVKMGRDLPANPASMLCNPKWCDYWSGCPHGGELEAKQDTIPTYVPTPFVEPKVLPTPAIMISELTALGAAVELVPLVDPLNGEKLIDLSVTLPGKTPRTYAWAATDAGKCNVISRAIRDVNRVLGIPIGLTAPTPTVTARHAPNEGAPVAVDDLRVRYVALDPAARKWIEGLREQAKNANVDFHLANNYTLRRGRILAGLLALAEAECDDDDALRAIVRHVVADEMVSWPTVPAGAAVGSMGVSEAERFVEACKGFVAGRYGLEMRLDGPELVVAA